MAELAEEIKRRGSLADISDLTPYIFSGKYDPGYEKLKSMKTPEINPGLVSKSKKRKKKVLISRLNLNSEDNEIEKNKKTNYKMSERTSRFTIGNTVYKYSRAGMEPGKRISKADKFLFVKDGRAEVDREGTMALKLKKNIAMETDIPYNITRKSVRPTREPAYPVKPDVKFRIGNRTYLANKIDIVQSGLARVITKSEQLRGKKASTNKAFKELAAISL